MKYYIQCKNFMHASMMSMNFMKLYSKTKENRMRNGYIDVPINDDIFQFFYEGKRQNAVSSDDFVKKYFGSQK